MNARLAALITALETLVVVGIGVGILFAPLTLVWALDDAFSTDLLVYWRTAADVWLLGHGVPVSVALDPALAASVGLGEASSSFVLSAAPLGPAVLTFWWGFRMGRRDLVLDFPQVVWLVGVGTMVALSYGVHVSSTHDVASTPLLDSLVRPSLFLAAGLIVASWTTKWSQGRQWLQSVLTDGAWRVLSSGFRAGIAAVAIVLAVASVFFFTALLVSYSDVIALFESLGPSVMGLVVLFVGQLAFVPNLVVWNASWLIGPGFSLGTGAHFSPLGADVQALPAVPLLAALPDHSDGFGFTLVAVPLVAAIVAGALAERGLGDRTGLLWKADQAVADQPLIRTIAASVIGGVIALSTLLLLAALSSGSFGPGRFRVLGVDLAQLALWWGVEAVAGVMVGMLCAVAWRWIRLNERSATSRAR